MIYTLVGKPFKEWVDAQVDIRLQKVTDDRNMSIMLDPEIAAIYKASTSVSGKFLPVYILCFTLICFSSRIVVNKGVSSNLMKATSKRRRGRQEIIDEKAAEVARQEALQEKLDRFEMMEEQIRILQQRD